MITTIRLVNICHHTQLQNIFLVMRTFKIYSQSKFQHNKSILCNIAIDNSIIIYSNHAVHYIPMTYLFYNFPVISLYLLTPFTHLAHAYPQSFFLWCVIYFPDIGSFCCFLASLLFLISDLIMYYVWSQDTFFFFFLNNFQVFF